MVSIQNYKGKVYSWGWGRYGNLGLGDKSDRHVLQLCTFAHSSVWENHGEDVSIEY